MTDLKIDIAKLSAELFELAKFSDVPNPDVTRVMLSDTDLAARKYLIELFRAAGLQVRIDAAGNIFSRWQGSDGSAPAIATGSHTDAIPQSGMYDGTVGVLGGLEAIRALQRTNFKPRRSIELIMFTSEEPTRYGVGCLGSRLMSGNRSAADAAKLVDSDGVSFGEFHRGAGGEGTLDERAIEARSLSSIRRTAHRAGAAVGTGRSSNRCGHSDCGAGAFRVIYEGSGGHAGAVLMPERRDALLPAAKLALDVDAAARTLGGPTPWRPPACSTFIRGPSTAFPAALCWKSTCAIFELARRDKVFEHLRRQAQLRGDEHRQKTTIEVINPDPPTTCDRADCGCD